MARIIATDSAETVTGTEAADQIYGLGGNDIIYGLAGDDELFGWSGSDTLYGGEGNDVLDGQDAHDTLVGGPGADILIGGAGSDTASYATSSTGIVLNLLTGVSTGDAEGDTLSEIEYVVGSAYGDKFVGPAQDYVSSATGGLKIIFKGEDGDDVFQTTNIFSAFYGGPGSDKVDYSNIDSETYQNKKLLGIALSGSGNGENLYSIGGFALSIGDIRDVEEFTLSNFDDEMKFTAHGGTVYGLGGNDIFESSTGTEIVDGGAGTDTVSYVKAPADPVERGVTVNLVTGQGTGSWAENDTYVAVENVTGTVNRDILIGNAEDNVLNGYDGADVLEGGAGYDTISYFTESVIGAGVVINLSTGFADGGFATGDTFSSIENIEGSVYDDHLTGDAGNNIISGGTGGASDQLYGLAGNDTLSVLGENCIVDGGEGNDTAAFTHAQNAYNVGAWRVDLVTGEAYTNSVFAYSATLISIENVIGYVTDDIISGDGVENVLNGMDGNDTLSGRGGFDTLVGGAGNDRLDGGTNPTTQGDILLGGLGNDTYLVDSALDLVDEGIVFGGAADGVDEIISTADFFWDFYSAGDILRIAEGANDPGNDGTTGVGSVFSNTLIGNSGTNVLFGRGGADTYRAGDGIDFMSLSLLGLTEANAYAGVDGVNTVIVEQRSTGLNSYDIIFEFEAGKDKVNVADYASVNGLSSGADVVARAVDDGIGNSYIALGDGLDYVYMVGLEKADLQAGDFLVA